MCVCLLQEKHLKEKHQLADDAKDYFINSELTHNRIYAIAEESELAFVGDQIVSYAAGT